MPASLAREMFKRDKITKKIKQPDGCYKIREYFVCKICEKQVTKMSAHIWNHNKPATAHYCCKFCTFKSYYYGNILIHAKKKHPKQVEKLLKQKYYSIIDKHKNKQKYNED